MNPYLVDVPVAIIFFNRPEPLKHVFEAVRKARPSKLFLIQDGCRANNAKDAEAIEKCKEVIQNIDWECEVYRNYSDVNLGCGMRMYSGITWAFETVDRLIILEDDCVPSDEFFRYCDELLEKYKDDFRIKSVTGMNNIGVHEQTPYSYFFSTVGSCCGWATWKRSWEQVEYDMPFMEDEDALRLISKSIRPKGYIRRMQISGKKTYGAYKKGGKLSAWTFQYAMSRYLNYQLFIVPKYNMITNIGIGDDATHGASSVKMLPRGLRELFFMKSYPIEFPLKHPKYVIDDTDFAQKLWKRMGYGFFRRKYRKVESIVYRILYGDFKNLFKALKKKIMHK